MEDLLSPGMPERRTDVLMAPDVQRGESSNRGDHRLKSRPPRATVPKTQAQLPNNPMMMKLKYRDSDADKSTIKLMKSPSRLMKSIKKNQKSALKLSRNDKSSSSAAREISNASTSEREGVTSHLSIFTSIPTKQKEKEKESAPTTNHKDQISMPPDIGMRLALPDKLGIMCGKEAASPLHVRSVSDGVLYDETMVNDQFSSSRSVPAFSPNGKKLLMVQESQSKPFSAIRRKSALIKNSSLFKSSHLTSSSSSNNSDRVPPEPSISFGSNGSSSSGGEEIIIRSSELEPSVHQVTIPPATDVLMYARICTLMESYDLLLDKQTKARVRWFNFADLTGVTREQLEAMYMKKTGQKPIYKAPDMPLGGNPFSNLVTSTPPMPPSPLVSPSKVMRQPPPSPQQPLIDPFENLNIQDGSGKPGQKQPKLLKKKSPHPSIIKSLLECGDDLVVEGYFSETVTKNKDSGDEENMDVVQATVFSSHRQRKFIVCYRGKLNQQDCPVKKSVKQNEDESSNLHKEHPVTVNTTFRDAYFNSRTENKVFELLNKLTTENPFCDVVFTGHSFGGALSTIGSLRYAALYPMIMVHCLVFGTPKVGGLGFRHLGNSLPNCRTIRVEHGVDYFPRWPEGPKWEHVGHTLTISAMVPLGENEPYSTINTARKLFDHQSRNDVGDSQRQANDKNSNTSDKQSLNALIYRFDERRPTYGKSKAGKSMHMPHISMSKSKKTQGKSDHDMRSYVHAVEQFTHLGLPWVTDFVGKEGEGIRSGVDKEERHVV